MNTAALDLWIRSRWRFPFNVFWQLFGFFFARAIGQFVYPQREGQIETRAFALERARDGRGNARAIVRTYVGSGDVMQAAAYATWQRAGTRLMSACFPLPLSRVMGLLRMDPLPDGGVVLTSVRKMMMPAFGSSSARSRFPRRSAKRWRSGPRTPSHRTRTTPSRRRLGPSMPPFSVATSSASSGFGW